MNDKIKTALDMVAESRPVMNTLTREEREELEASARRQIEDAQLRGGWQPIETAPREGKILAIGWGYGDPANGYHDPVITHWDDGGWIDGHEASDGGPSGYTYLTHWMPLPALPNER